MWILCELSFLSLHTNTTFTVRTDLFHKHSFFNLFNIKLFTWSNTNHAKQNKWWAGLWSRHSNKANLKKKKKNEGKSLLHPASRQSRVSLHAGLPPKHPIIHFPFPAMRKDLQRSNVIVKPPKNWSTTNLLGCYQIQCGNKAPVCIQH